MDAQSFSGFSTEFFNFYRGLIDNNNREWFSDNKEHYENNVIVPLQMFIESIAPRLQGISPYFIASPKKVGGSIFRIYRDVRFSKDKRPYKEHAACQFRHEAGKDAHAPGYYLHLSLEGVVAGAGVWLPESKKLNKIREKIANKPELWEKVRNHPNMSWFNEGIEGDGLTRPPKGFAKDLEWIDDIKRKSFFVKKRFTIEQAQSSRFIDEVAESYAKAAPLMSFLCDALDVSYTPT